MSLFLLACMFATNGGVLRGKGASGGSTKWGAALVLHPRQSIWAFSQRRVYPLSPLLLYSHSACYRQSQASIQPFL